MNAVVRITNMKSIHIIIIGLLMMGVMIAGCTQTSYSNQNQPGVDVESNKGHVHQEWSDGVPGEGYWIYKVAIPEDNVTCYVMDNYEGGGISCFKGTQ
jgi:glucose uptake protein GlcU